MKKIRIVLIVLIVINLITLLCLLIMPKVKSYDYTSYAIEQFDKKVENGEFEYTKPVRDSIISFENSMILLENYYGELNTGMVNVKFTDLLDYGFKQLYDETYGMDAQALSTYLNQNEEYVGMLTGITNSYDLQAFLQKIETVYEDEDIKCEKAEIVEDSYVNGYDYDTFKIKISYENGKELDFDVSLSNKDFISTPLVIIK